MCNFMCSSRSRSRQTERLECGTPATFKPPHVLETRRGLEEDAAHTGVGVNRWYCGTVARSKNLDLLQKRMVMQDAAAQRMRLSLTHSIMATCTCAFSVGGGEAARWRGGVRHEVGASGWEKEKQSPGESPTDTGDKSLPEGLSVVNVSSMWERGASHRHCDFFQV